MILVGWALLLAGLVLGAHRERHGELSPTALVLAVAGTVLCASAAAVAQ